LASTRRGTGGCEGFEIDACFQIHDFNSLLLHLLFLFLFPFSFPRAGSEVVDLAGRFPAPLKSRLHFSDKSLECALCRVGLPVRAEEWLWTS
jgi:hypothetical protein